MHTRSVHWSGAAKRRAALLLALVLLLTTCASAAPAPTPAAPELSDTPSAAPASVADDAAEPNDAVFTDLQGRFSVPRPTDWTAEQWDDILALSDPEGLISTYALVLANADPQTALAAPWRGQSGAAPPHVGWMLPNFRYPFPTPTYPHHRHLQNA